MTEKEIAYELGMRIIKARFWVSAMTGELDSYRDAGWNQIPWRGHVDEIVQSLSDVAQERADELKSVLDVAKPEEMLRTLHMFLKENL